MPDEKTAEKEQDYAEFDAAFAESTQQRDAGTDTGEPVEIEGREPEVSTDDATASEGEEHVQVDLESKIAELEAETERLKQSERSQRGRVSALTKKLEEQRAAFMKPPAADQEGDDGEDGDWEEFKNEFPEMAAIIEKRLNSVAQKVDTVNERVALVNSSQETLVDMEMASYREAQFAILGKKHPDFEEIKASKEFAEFKANAPQQLQEKIRSNHAEDAIEVLDIFKERTRWGYGKGENAGKSEVELLNEKRAENLRRSAGISSKKVGHSTQQDAVPDEGFDAAFAKRAREIEKQRASRY